MILIDTTIWIDHFSHGDARVTALLTEEYALMHPFVLGEFALGSIPDRQTVLEQLGKLPAAEIAEPSEVLSLIDSARLHGSGIGYVDAHLVASTLLTSNGRLLTRDRRLAAVATRLGIAFA